MTRDEEADLSYEVYYKALLAEGYDEQEAERVAYQNACAVKSIGIEACYRIHSAMFALGQMYGLSDKDILREHIPERVLHAAFDAALGGQLTDAVH
jgi:hypothetical protein